MVKACWEATWEPEYRLCQDDAHQRLIDDYRATHLEVPPRKLWASNIDQQQPVSLQQGLNARQAACNAYHAGLKERLHISIDPINPDLDIHSTGQAVVQCEMISDCYIAYMHKTLKMSLKRPCGLSPSMHKVAISQV